MVPRGGATHRNWLHINANKLLSVAEVVLRQAENGTEPALGSTDLAAAQRAIKELRKASNVPIALNNETGPVWRTRGRSGAALMALLSLSLRRASPFAVVGDGHHATYDDILDYLSGQLSCALTAYSKCGALCAEVLGPALLQANTLQCYARILATVAEQLQPAAAARVPMPTGSTHASVAPGVDRAEAAADAAGEQPTDQHQQQQQQQPARRQVHHVRTPQLPTLDQLDSFLRGPLSVLEAVGLAHEHINVTLGGAGVATVTAGGGQDLNCSSSSFSPVVRNPYIDLLKGTRAHVHSSWVLEHWARVLLLGTAPALADASDSKQQANPHITQVQLLHRLCVICRSFNVDMSDFLRRPCGCTLAATHMALTCAALDGGHAFGWPRPAALVAPVCFRAEDFFLLRTSGAAREWDAAAVEAGRLVSLLPELHFLRGWISLLAEALQEAPGKGRRAAGGQDAAVGGIDELKGAGRGSGQEGRQPVGAAAEMPAADGHGTGAAVQALGESVEAPAGVVVVQGTARGGGGGICAGHGEVGDKKALPNQGRTGPVGQGSQAAAFGLTQLATGLPPLNRSATVALCLRLAKGVLARWGAKYVRLQVGDAHSADSTLSVQSVMPKVGGCSLLYNALACARLALLPDVWGRDRVPGRTRAQLREWWETYVAAAQHPEALTVAVQDQPTYPDWTYDLDSSSWPSADASAALAAGLLPCMTRLVTRMGAGSSGDGGQLWCLPDAFPGTNACWLGVLLRGPLGQVGELVSAVDRRLRLAVEELRRTAEAAGGGRPGRKSVGWLVEAAHEVLNFAKRRLSELFGEAVRDLCGSPASSGGDGRAHVEVAGPTGQTEGQCASGAVGVAGGVGASASQRAAGEVHLAETLSYAMAELLPAVSHGLRVCAELGRRAGAGRGQGQAPEREGEGLGAAEQVLRDIHECCLPCAGATMDFAMLYLKKYSKVHRAEQHCSAGLGAGGGGGSSSSGCSVDGAKGAGGTAWTAVPAADDSGGGGSSSSSSRGRDGSGATGAVATGADTVWLRQLLLQDVRLLELLGACLELYRQGRAAPEPHVLSPHDRGWAVGYLERKLRLLLPLAAAAFPADFRAAVGGAGADGGMGAEWGVGQAMCSNRSGEAPPCISLAMAREVLLGREAEGCGDEGLREVFDRVLIGWDPTPDEVWGAVCRCCEWYNVDLGRLDYVLGLLLPPAEARAAVVVAATAAAGLGVTYVECKGT